MTVIDEIKNILVKLIDISDVTSSRLLLRKSMSFKEQYDADMCYLNARVCLLENNKVLALYWAEMGFMMNRESIPNLEVLSFLWDKPIDSDEYVPYFVNDISFLNKKHKIVLYLLRFHIFEYNINMFKQIFEALGHDVYIFDVENVKEAVEDLKEFARGGLPDMTFCFNNSGWNFSLDGNTAFCDAYNIPSVNFLFDHPFYYCDSLDNSPKNGIVTCVDQNHVTYANKFYETLNRSMFLPLGGEELAMSKLKSFEERNIEVLYIGSLKVGKLNTIDGFYDKVSDFLTNNPSYTTEDGITECFAKLTDKEYEDWFGDLSAKHIDRHNPELKVIKSIIEKYSAVDVMVNSAYRGGAVAALVNAGITVTVYGNDMWKTLETSHPECLKFMGHISPSECIEKICDSKIVLNSMPWFKAGTHDRVCNAMLNGAVCVTDPSSYVEERFKDGEDLFYYHLERLYELPQIIRFILSNPDKANEVIRNAYNKVWYKDTWQNRGIELLRGVFNE